MQFPMSTLPSIHQYVTRRVAPLVVAVFAAFGLALYYLIVVPAQDKFAMRELLAAAQHVESRTATTIEEIENEVRIAGVMVETGRLGVDDVNGFNAEMMPILEQRTRFTSAVLANEHGREILLLREDDGSWRNRITDIEKWGKRQRWLAWSPEGKLLSSEWRVGNYDPRNRPWYQGAMSTQPEGAVNWSDAYRFVSTGLLGVSASMRAIHRATGTRYAFDLDVRVRDLSRYTSSLRVGDNGYVVMLQQDGRILGLPRNPQIPDEAQFGERLLKTPQEAGLPVLGAALAGRKDLQKASDVIFKITVSGETWLARISPLPLGRSKHLLMATMAPATDFPLADRVFAATLGALLAAMIVFTVILSLYFSRLFSRTLNAIVRETERIGNLDLERPVKVNVNVMEFEALGNALDRTRVLLGNSNARLETDVENRTLELSRREAELRTILENAPIGIMFVGDGRLLRCNAKLAADFGYDSPEDLQGKVSPFLIHDKENFEILRQQVRVVLETGKLYESEWLVERRSGEPFWCRVMAKGLPMSGTGTRYYSIWMFQDITARRQAEEAMRLVSEERQAIFESATLGIVLLKDRVIHSCNQRFEEMLRYPRGELIGKSSRVMYIDDESFEASASVYETLGRGEILRRERHIRRADGTLFWCRLGSRAIDPRILDHGIVSTLEDITDEHAAAEALKNAKQIAEEAARSKSMFLATMSHEIRTPMNGVLGMLELLDLSNLQAEQRATLDTARESAHSLLRIIDDILDFSKIEAGKLDIRSEPASLAAIVESVFLVHAGNASSKNLSLRRSVDRRISPAHSVDPIRLRQILGNLVSNAVKFTQEGVVEIKATLLEKTDGFERVGFEVRDTGIGISAENQAKLFQPFAQAEADTTRRFGGTGLGLAICQQLASMMDTSISMDSEPGRGTTVSFSLNLPVADPKDLPGSALATDASATFEARRKAPDVTSAQTEGTLVLVADDHPANRTLMTRQLNALGYAVESVHNGVDALEKWRSGRFAIVITDCHMPEMDGYELSRSIRELEKGSGKRTAIIACTASALAGEEEMCFAAGMDDHLVKPVSMGNLAEKLDQWLPLPRAAAADHGAAINSAPRQAKSAPSPIDRSKLAQICGGDAEMELEILADFRRAHHKDTAALRRALAEHDVDLVTRASHRIKGASVMIGAEALVAVCEKLEVAGHARDWDAITAHRETLFCEIDRVDEYLRGL
jgi:PAS domain S-box-containing protein